VTSKQEEADTKDETFPSPFSIPFRDRTLHREQPYNWQSFFRRMTWSSDSNIFAGGSNYVEEPPKLTSQTFEPKIDEETFDNLSVSNSASNSTSKRGPYRMFTFEQRSEVIEMANTLGISAASKSFAISKKRIMRWLRNGPERKKGAGRKTLDPAMENNLVEWIKDSIKNKGHFPTRQQIKAKAKNLCTVESFRASKGWCDKFFKRNTEILSRLRKGN